MQLYQNNKQLLKEKEEAIVELQSLYDGLVEKPDTSDGKSQTADLQVCSSYRKFHAVLQRKFFNGKILLKLFRQDCRFGYEMILFVKKMF